jgi:mycoredoxin
MSDTEVLTVYTTAWCGDCVAAKRALDGLGVPYREVRLDDDPAAVAFVESVNDGRRSVPTLAVGEHAASLSNFSPRRLGEFLRGVGLSGSGVAASGD